MIGGGVQLGQKQLVDGDQLPFRHIYSAIGSGAEPIPEGAVSVTITVYGAGGGGSRVSGSQGFGGGSGGVATRMVAVDPGDWGNGVLWEVTDPGYGRSGSIGNGSSALSNGVSSGTDAPGLAAWTGQMSAFGAKGATTAAAGAGGTAQGGTANTNGAAGGTFKGGNAPGTDGGDGGQTPGADGSAYGGGGAGGFKSDGQQTDGGDGGAGAVIFDWS